MKKKVWSLLLVVLLVLSGMGVQITEVKAAVLFDVVAGGSAYVDAIPGDSVTVKIPVKPTFPTLIQSITAIPSEGAPITTGPVSLTDVLGNDVVGDLVSYVQNQAKMEFEMNIKDSAKIGTYYVNIVVTGRYLDTNGEGEIPISGETVMKIAVRVSSEKAPIQLIVDSVSYDKEDVKAGESFNLNLNIKNEGDVKALNVFLKVGYGDTGITPSYTVENKSLGDLAAKKATTVTLPLKVLPATSDGMKTIVVEMECKDSDGKSATFTRNIYINVTKDPDKVSSDDTKIVISSPNNNTEVVKGQKIDFKVKIENRGAKTATDMQVVISGGLGKENGIIKDYADEGVAIPDLGSKKSRTVSMPLSVLQEALPGVKELEITVHYKDENDNWKATTTRVYFTQKEIKEEDKEEPIKETQVVISGVAQNPSRPVAGSEVTVSFTIENKGETDLRNFKIGGTNLSTEGFEPVSSDAFQHLNTIAVGEKKGVTFTFRAGKDIKPGLNPLEMTYTYTAGKGEGAQKTETTKFYILNVVNHNLDEVTSTRPKLIISDTSTDVEDLNAGSTFNFTFDIRNTHASKSATNIKVTLTQADNVFSATQGSNSFFIDRIGPGEVSQNTINMKVKADTATNAYDLSIAVEYEYEDMSKIDEESGGVKDESKIKLQAIEKARPEVQNLRADNYGEPPMVDMQCNLSFEFFNMGKSQLTNVFFTVEGDFIQANNSTMQFYGNLAAAGSDYVEIPIIPSLEGEAKGKLLIHFEDSNGDEIIKEKEFTASVMPVDNGGDFIPGDEGEIPGMNPEVIEPAKPIMEWWMFIVIQAAILVIAIPVTYKIIITIKRKKMQKEVDSDV